MVRYALIPSMPAIRSDEKALQAFEQGARENVDCEVLLKDTWIAFSALERWETAESNIRSVQSSIESVRHYGHDYYHTLRDSNMVALARKFWTLSPDMRAYGKEALEKSQSMSNAYRDIRKGLNQISDGIPRQMAKIERREQRVVEKKEALERRIRRARVVKNVGTAVVAVASGVSIVAFPPMMLIIPVGIPIAILAIEAYEHKSSQALLQRQDEIMDCQIGLQQLKDITSCLAFLAQHVDILIEFWSRSDTMLESIANGVARIKGNTPRLKLRLKATIASWKDVGEIYTDYVTKLKKIETFRSGSLQSQLSITSSGRTHPR
ncbi:hypothetical protein C8R46DRAFT_1065997, partial [Mycena filopes]